STTLTNPTGWQTSWHERPRPGADRGPGGGPGRALLRPAGEEVGPFAGHPGGRTQPTRRDVRVGGGVQRRDDGFAPGGRPRDAPAHPGFLRPVGVDRRALSRPDGALPGTRVQRDAPPRPADDPPG